MIDILSEQELRLLEVVGIWAAAFATVFATYTALRIARRQDDIRLAVSVVDGLIVSEHEKEDIVWLSITNIGRRTATIRSVGWRFSPLTSIAIYQKIDPPNPPLPILLKDGDSATITFPVHRQPRGDWYQMMAEPFLRFNKLQRLIELRFFRLEISCSTGERFLKRPNDSFRKRLKSALDVIEEQKTAVGAPT